DGGAPPSCLRFLSDYCESWMLWASMAGDRARTRRVPALLRALEEGVARLPEGREEHIVERTLELGHGGAACADGAQAQMALGKLEMRCAEEVELLVEVGQRLGTIVEAGGGARVGVEVRQRDARALQRRREGVP